MPSPKTCITASLIVSDVSERGTSLTKASIKRLSTVPEGAYGEIKEIAWGTIRWYFHYKKLLATLLHHPLEKNEKIILSPDTAHENSISRAISAPKNKNRI